MDRRRGSALATRYSTSAIALTGAASATTGTTPDSTAATTATVHTARAGSGTSLRTAIGPAIASVAA